MMNELVDTVSRKTGLSPEQARGAIDTVLGFIREKLPASVSECLEPHLTGNETAAAAGSESLLSRAAGAVGGLFGKDK